MKLRITLKAAMAAAVVIAFAFLFSACVANWFYPEVELALVSVKIGDLEITAIPAPIAGDDWDDEEYEVASSDLGFVIVKKEADLVANSITAEASIPGAVVTWGLAKGGSRPARFNDQRAPATFDKTDFFFFRVYDPETENARYYRFFPRDASIVKELAGFAIAGRDPDKIPEPAPNLDTLVSQITGAAFRGTIYITRAEALEALIAATPKDAAARIKYSYAESVAQAQAKNFIEIADAEVVVVQDEQGKDITQGHHILELAGGFKDASIIAVQVTAQNEDVNCYGFMVYSERMATIASLKFDGIEVTGKGTPNTDSNWSNIAAGSYDSADQGIGGFNITIQLEDSEGTAEWGVIAAGTDSKPTYTPGLSLTRKFNHQERLAIKVNSPRGTAGDIRYYKVQVNLLAAKFTRHPQSAAYTITDFSQLALANSPGSDWDGRILVDDPANVGKTVTLDRDIAELSFALDRDMAEGTTTYQWYSANSWYGGYGFDRDGRLVGDPRTISDYYHPNPNALDEKNNVSFHNGGNQFYRLSIPGRPISGATQATYTPTIDARNRPFITGFSNQTQYYWVIVTDSSDPANPIIATSDRAAIVTEWGRAFTLGKPADPVTKTHYIFDMHAYMDSGAVGLKDNPRNATPFKAGNHGDQYLIPLTFPAGFNVKDYSIVTCWAKFYLADGREWIQNWTQGDFGFADASEGSLVLWYNLTNDNATRGLGGSGNEPAGGGLDETPGFLIVKPAGTKPIKEMPPFSGKMKDVPKGDAWAETYKAVYGEDNRDKPLEDGKAQGWFTPYIEIVELRFEGPVR